MPGRGTGERLAVDPNNPSVLLFGARSGNGLYRSDDGGESFSQVESFEGVGTFIPDPSDVGGYNGDIHGLTFVTFDETSELVDGATGRIFVGTADNETASVYVSEDAGSTWSAVEGQPDTYFPHKGRISPEEGALYLSYSDGTGPYDGTSGAVWRYDIAGGEWTDITPDIGQDLYHGFGGLALDAQNPGTLMVVSLNSWWPDAQIFRSTDSGATWSTIWGWGADGNQAYNYEISTPLAPWIYEDFISVDTKKLGWMIEALEIDPLDSDHWLYGTGLTVYGGRDLTGWDAGTKVNVQSLADGIEEFAVLGLASAPGASELLAAVGDDSGFTFRSVDDLGTAPQTAWDNPMFTSSTDVDFAGAAPETVVRVGNSAGSPQLARSEDGGVTWAVDEAAGDEAFGGRVALSADGDVVVWSSESSGVLRGADGAFEAVDAVPSGAAVASDKVDNGVFYAGAEADLLVSDDGGATWTEAAGSLGAATAIRDIVAHPAVAGEIYVSTDAGIFRSADGGATLEALPSLDDTHRIALGRGPGDGWVLYAFGHGADGARLYATADGGVSWVDVQGAQGFGSIDSCVVAGSANVAGVVYVGTNGRGVFHAEVVVGGDEPVPSGTAPAPSASA